MKKVYVGVTQHPCTENAMNSNLLKRWFEANGWSITKKAGEADIVIISTCGFNKSSEDYEIEEIRKKTSEKKPSAELIVVGCLPEINRERLRKEFNGVCISTKDIMKFNEHMNFPKKLEEFDNNFISAEEYDANPRIAFWVKARAAFEKWAKRFSFIKVPQILLTTPSPSWFCVRCATGCTGNCSYCGIRHAQGFINSFPIPEIVRQAEKGLAMGYKEIALTGEDMGGYGVDKKEDLADLLNELIKLRGDFSINLRFIDPYWLIKLFDKLLPAFNSGKILSFCVPAQSGSDRILKSMNRRYTFSQIKNGVNDTIRHTKVKMISTNIIVGFPGETDQDFRDTLRLIKEVDFSLYMTFLYEDRPNTKSILLPNKISQEIKTKRFNIIHKLTVKKHIKSFLRFF
ncbi:MAG: radical SAM protein [Candidatus Riflebacteria bacterium]|nr:radical SAM protein [Candidatus Riflebacteria bacterium]